MVGFDILRGKGLLENELSVSVFEGIQIKTTSFWSMACFCPNWIFVLNNSFNIVEVGISGLSKIEGYSGNSVYFCVYTICELE